MNTITHALFPVIAACFAERVDRGPARKGKFSNREIVAIGLMGAAPDLLDPHLSLTARYASWSHGLPAWLVFSVVGILLVPLFVKHFSCRLAIWGSLAYLLHLGCDLIAGGIAWLYPLRPEVLGRYYVPPQWWAWIDVICILVVYGMWRVAPHFARKAAHGSQETKM